MLQIADRGPEFLPRDFDVGIDPPPANDSAQTRYELETLRIYKKERTRAVRQKIEYENGADRTNPDFFADVVDHFDIQHYPLTMDLMNIAVKDVTFFVVREKKRYQRARPSQLADDLDPVIENPAHASYPSGHAAQMYALALLLSALDPQRKDMYTSKAFDIARRREIAGVHYPGDSIAGFALATVVMEALMDTEEFKTYIPMAQKEFSAVR